MRPIVLLMFITALALLVPASGVEDPAQREPDAARGPTIAFTNVSEETGLSGLTGNFFSWGDVDNDGHQDLLIDGKRLMRNTGPPHYRFQDISSKEMLESRSNSGVFADIDNDGWLDIFCGGGSLSSDHPTVPDILWRNKGGGTFEDVTSSAGGLSDTFPTAAGGWADLDRNGFVDLYMVNYENGTYQGYPDHLWTNDGGGRFTNRSDMVQKNGTIPSYQGRGVSWADFDNDGWQDAYISNYRIMRNFLFRNQKGRGLIEAAEELGVEGHASFHPVTRDGPYYGHSLGSSWGDLDNDGDLDLWVTNLAHKDPWRGPICDDSYLFENLGAEQGYAFRDRREGSGIEVKTIPGTLGGGDELMVSSSLADYDNDGDLDLFIPQIYGDIGYAHSLLYRNEGGLTFTEVGAEAGVRVWNTYGSAWCDYNEDGWIDLVTGGGEWEASSSTTKGYMVHLFRNDGGASGSSDDWLKVSLEGRTSNSAAIGARAICLVDTDGDGKADRTVLREVQGGQGAHGQQDSMVLHLGLGEVKGSVDLEVRWPLGRTSVVRDVMRNMHHHLIEPDDEVQVSITLETPTQTPDGTLTRFSMENTCAHPLSDTELEVRLDNAGVPSFATAVVDGTLGPGESYSSSVLVEGAEWDEGSSLTLEVIRSFPPVTSPQQGTIEQKAGANLPPVAVLTGPDRAIVGETVRFSAVRSYDQDGIIVKYVLDPGDGTGPTEHSVPDMDHTFGDDGSYLVSLSVVDGSGLRSEVPSVLRIEVEARTTAPPTAVMVRVSPTTARAGEAVLFEGKGTADMGSTIERYLWTSSLDGVLSRERSFTTRELSVGEHTVHLTVTDSNGLTSLPDTTSIDIIGTEPPELSVMIERPLEGSVVKGVLKARGNAAPADVVEKVEVRLDNGTWTRTSDHMLPGWELVLDIRSLTAGQHRLEVRAWAGQRTSPVANVTFLVPGYDARDDTTDQKGELVPHEIYIIVPTVLLLLVIMILTFAVFRSGRLGHVRSVIKERESPERVQAVVLEEVIDGKSL